jgi:PAS domain S-box-containing protein
MAENSDKTQLEILYNVSRELAASLDLHTVLERVLNLSTSNIGAERASLVILDEKGNPLDAAIIINGSLVPTTIEQMHDVMTSGLAGWVVRNRELAVLNNTDKDERWLSRSTEKVPGTTGKSALCIPVMAHDDLVGVLTIVHSRINFFTEEDIALQKAIVELAGISVQNARLYNQVQNAQQRYYDLFEESLDTIFITDLNGKIIEANQEACAVTSKTVKQLKKLKISDLHAPEYARLGTNFEMVTNGTLLAYESTLKKADGTLLPVEVHVSRVIAASDICLQWLFRDIQEEKKLIDLRNDLSAMLYHDLRSPLANIISSMDIMGSLIPLEDSETLQSVFDVARRSTERMQRMIDGLLDINRLESGQQITRKQKTRLTYVLDDACEVIQGAAKNKEITISKEIEPGLPDVMVDSEMIRRVIINLTENSIKFSPNGSTIRLGMVREGVFIKFFVEDHGQGIPEENKEEIFEKFVRLKQNYPIKGLGLGLAFCKLAVQAHGGKIWVENNPQGGSRFVFTLPVS